MKKKTVQWLAALAVVQLGLIAGLWLLETRGGDVPRGPLLSVAQDGLQSLRIEAAGQTLVLQRRDGAWQLADSGLPVAANRLHAALDALSSAAAGWPVATTDDAIARFGLEAEAPRKRIVLADDDSEQVLLLGDAAGLNKVYARLPDEHKVYSLALDGFVWSTAGDDWLDKTLLRVAEPETVTGADYQLGLAPADAGEAARHWWLTDAGPDEKLDPSRAQRLLDVLRGLRVAGVASGDLPANAETELTVTTAAGEQVLSLYRRAPDERPAQGGAPAPQWLITSTAQPGVFVLPAGSAEVLAWQRADLLADQVGETGGAAEQGEPVPGRGQKGGG
ncbi:MAG: DUF4340 domain-containing protein [Spongiibacteraceae bacterium]|nr:DUF4340 domain-containing protein [Spongiibacteraceae bacterium]